MTDVRVLGPLVLGHPDAPCTIAAGKQRVLLVALALHAGAPVTTDVLIDAIWSEHPPASAAKLVQIYVSQLRKQLPPDLRLETHPGSYSLALSPERVDALRFRQLVASAHRVRKAGDAHLAARLLTEALELWRGDALVDVPSAVLFDNESAVLSSLRIDSIEQLYSVRLDCGEAEQLTSELQTLSLLHPLREGLHASLSLALYRSGRQAEALGVYDALRVRLLAELAVDPGPELRDLHLRMLRQDPRLDVLGAIDALPAPLTRTVGRDSELLQLESLLADPSHRLVTLTGPGGGGKTRLSLVAAAKVRDRFPGGVAQVRLESVRDPSLVLATIAGALGLRDSGDGPLEALAAQLSTHPRLLIVLDNLEQVASVGPTLVTLLERLPGLTLLTTSRVLLGVTGEHAFPVHPLELPVAGTPPHRAESERSPAIILFCERARAAFPLFVFDDDNAASVIELCRRLDGLPLALELAAAQARTMSPAALLARWTVRLEPPGPDQDDRPARHRSLRSALDGSFALLTLAGRDLFARLSVFAGSFDLDAAERVCDGTSFTLAELVDHSLVHVAGGRDRRFRMLETVREYAAEQLTDDDVRRRHAAYFVALAEEARGELGGTQQAARLAQLDSEQDNFRSAFATLQQAGDVNGELRLAVALARYSYVRGHLAESRSRLSAALSRAETLPPQLRADALRKVSANAVLRGAYTEALELGEQAVLLYDEAADPLGRARALSNVGAAAHASGDLGRAKSALEEAITLARELGADRVVALALNNRGDLCLTLGDYAGAATWFEESHALLEHVGDELNIARSLLNRALSALGIGLTGPAAELVRRSLTLSVRLEDTEDIAWGLLATAAVLARTDQPATAALLLGAAEARLLEIEAEFKPYERKLHDATSASLHNALGEVGLYEARARGTQMSVSEAVATATAS